MVLLPQRYWFTLFIQVFQVIVEQFSLQNMQQWKERTPVVKQLEYAKHGKEASPYIKDPVSIAVILRSQARCPKIVKANKKFETTSIESSNLNLYGSPA
eukprot:403332549